MKKLFSLILVALISSQMWAVKVTFTATNAAISGQYHNTITTTFSTLTSNSTTVYQDYTIKITATPNSGYKYIEWTTTGIDLANCSQTTSGSNHILQFTMPNKNVTVTATATNSKPSVTKTAYMTNCDMTAHDMGTDDGILWGDRALGATSTTGVGLYYQYGNVTASTGSASTSYNYSGIYTASNNLPADKDPATAALGEGWRTPTSAEYTTLMSKATVSRTSTSVQSITAVANSKTIYFYMGGSKYGTSVSYASSSGNAYYWTSTKYSSSDAYRLNLSHTTSSSKGYVDGKSASGSNHTYFYYAQQIKPVYDAANYTLTVKADGTTSTNYSGKWGASTASITASKSGYTFVRWDDGNTSNPRTFKICNATYTAVFEAQKVTATFKNADNTTNFATKQVTLNSAPGNPDGSPTKEPTTTTVYTFNRWNTAQDGTGNGTNVAISSATTYYPIYTESTRNYTINFRMDDGTGIEGFTNLQVPYNDKPTAPADEDMTKSADESYTYAFAGWSKTQGGDVCEVEYVTGNQDYYAVFTATPIVVVPTYNITVGAYSNGTVTLTAGGDVQVVPAEGGVYNYLEGTTIIVKATANRGWHFTEWSDHTTNPSVRVSEIDGNKTFTPTFAANTPFTMLDTWTEADCMSNYDFANTLTVVLDGRTFTADQWATLSVPFTTTLTADDALYNMVYRLSVATLSQDGGSMHFEFVRTNAIEANEPYLIVPRQAVNEVVFYGVKLETPVEKHPTTDNRVEFVSSLWKQTIHGRNEFYVGANSTLRYASTTGTTVKGNRAFFRKIGDAVTPAPAPRRAIVVIDGEEREVEIADGNIEEVQNVRKYMENGVLIIERNGVRMDAQGKRID